MTTTRDGFVLDPDTGIAAISHDPGDTIDHPVDYAGWLRGGDQDWSPRSVYHAGAIVNPTVGNSNAKRYRATTAGRSGNTAPTWPSSSTVTDGGITWTTVGSRPTVSSVSVAAASGITATSQGIDATGNVVTVRVSGGTAGSTYRVTVTATLSTGEVVERSFDVIVEDL